MRVSANFTDWGQRRDRSYGGCGYYRIAQPGKYCGWRVTGPPPLDVQHGNLKGYFDWLLDGYDVLKIQRIDNPQIVRQFCDELARREMPFIIDLDDDYLHVNPLNPASSIYYVSSDPMTGRKIPSPKLLAVQAVISRATGLTVTTEKLRRTYSQFNPNIEVVPNFIDASFWDSQEPDTKSLFPRIIQDEIRIGWAGSTSHADDFVYFIEAFHEIAQKYKNVRFVSLGYCHVELMKLVPMFRWHTSNGSSHYDGYPSTLKAQELDIAVAPLKVEVFNESKSAIKVMEYGLCGLPVIATKGYGLPYNEIIRHGENGFHAVSKEDWVESLSALIESEDLRRRIGGQLRQDILDHHDIAKNASQHDDAIENIVAASKARLLVP